MAGTDFTVEIRTLKARMESERLPRGADRKTHFKLGHGGLSDVELIVYPGARHEVFNETNQQEVRDDLIAWLDARLFDGARATASD